MSGDSNCVFCRIAAGELPGELLHRDEFCFAIRDIAPAARVHVLLIPNRHLTHLDTFDAAGKDAGEIVGHLARVACRMAEAEGISRSGFRLIINQRDDAGQEVDHLHMHLIGGEKLGGLA